MMWASFLSWLALCQGAGLIGARWTTPEIPGWYKTLRKPSFNPPSWVFGPMWTTLYLLMAIAAYRVSQTRSSNARSFALAMFLVQLALNFVWPYIFFHKHALRGALLEIGVLWLSIFVTIAAFAQIDSTAALLLVPYIAWVSFATALNGSIVRLNPSKAS